MKNIIEEFTKWQDRAVDYFFNHILAMSTLIGVSTFIVHTWYPQHSAEFDTFVSAYLIHLRNSNAN